MAGSQFNIPLDLENEGLKRLLKDVTFILDVLTGVVTDKDIPTLATLQQAIEDNANAIKTINNTSDTNDNEKAIISREDQEVIDDIDSELSVLDFALSHKALDTSYRDFDHANWGVLKGNGTFTALGSTLINPPITLVAGRNYTIYADSIVLTTGGAAQRVLIFDPITLISTIHYRTGSAFSIMIFNGWTTVPDLVTLVATLGMVTDVLVYTARTGSNYIDNNSNIDEDLTDLDTQIKTTINTLVTTLGMVTSTLIYAARTGSNYIDNNSSIDEDLLNLDAQIKVIADAVVTLAMRVTTNENDITTLAGRITTNENDITTLAGRITTLEGFHP